MNDTLNPTESVSASAVKVVACVDTSARALVRSIISIHSSYHMAAYLPKTQALLRIPIVAPYKSNVVIVSIQSTKDY